MPSQLLDSALMADVWFGPQASTVAADVDLLYNALVWISAFFFAIIVFGTAWLAWKYRHREGEEAEPSPSHNTKIEVIWSVVPGILCVFIFWFGFEVYMDLKTVPQNAYEVDVQAYKWGWFFTYENGGVSNELHCVKGTPVRLVMGSQDVLHSLWISDFRVKQDCVPGRMTELWFEAPEAGEHHLVCAEYCGTNHSNMKTKVVVHETEEDFAVFKKQAADLFIDPENPEVRRPAEVVGSILYERNCKPCHGNAAGASTELAPNFFEIEMGKDRGLAGGQSVTYDFNYIKESIWNPQAKIVAGYENKGAMPSFAGQLNDEYVKAMIAYFKSLK